VRKLLLFQKNAKLRELLIDCRSSESSQTKLKDSQIDFDKTVELWAKDDESLVKHLEDVKFLKPMKTHRAASFGSCDKIMAL
jgi:hypothetical protein